MMEAAATSGAYWLRLIVGLVIVLIFSQLNALFLVWLERKVAGHIQVRLGPMEVGPHGLLQTIVDGIKLVGKELITPARADRKLFVIAPVLVFMPVLVAFLVLPFGPQLIIRDMNVGSFSSSPFHLQRLGDPCGRLGVQQQVCPAGGHPFRGPGRGL